MTRERIRRRKIAYLWQVQQGRCAITGQELDPAQVHNRWYAQLHHAISQADMNKRLYPRFIHSVWNLHLVKAGPHGTFPTPKGIPHLLACRIDELLKDDEDLRAAVNMERDGAIDVVEMDELFKELVQKYDADFKEGGLDAV